MPRRAPQDSTRCVYTESGRRCKRSGTGEPPVCAAHKIAFAEAAQRATAARRPGDAIHNLFDSFLSGRKITRKKVEAAWSDFGELLDAAPGFMPPGAPLPGWMPPRPSSSPPPEDPAAVAARKEFAEAKRVLGFADSQRITADDVRERKKDLARKYHPDKKGGSLERMQQINAAADVLLRAA